MSFLDLRRATRRETGEGALDESRFFFIFARAAR